jgi:hypothetical protein
MSGGSDPRWDDPRDRDDQSRDVEVHWIELGRGPASDRQSEDDARARDDNGRDPPRVHDSRERGHDPRDVFLGGLELPRGLEREVVLDHDHRYDDRLRHLRDEGLIRTVSLDGRERAVTLTARGRHLLDAHRRDGGDARHQAFHAGVSRPRELTHDASLYRAYLSAEDRLREQGAEIHRVVLEGDLKREYQEWLQEHNRGRSDSDGRPDRDSREIEEWALDHDLPYFEDHGSYCPPGVDASYNKLGCVSITLMRKPLRRPRLTCTA